MRADRMFRFLQTSELFSKGGRYCLRLIHKLLLGRLGYGTPVSRSVWERQYLGGNWDFLYSPLEIDHYLVIVAFVEKKGQGLRILDVGCGAGRLLELLKTTRFTKYVGVDISAAAIGKARALTVPNTEFAVADFQSWTPNDKFDVIIFNESLYYAYRPVYTAKRYCKWLIPGGLLIASLAEYGNHEVIWRQLDNDFRAYESKTVSNTMQQRWTVKAFVTRTS